MSRGTHPSGRSSVVLGHLLTAPALASPLFAWWFCLPRRQPSHSAPRILLCSAGLARSAARSTILSLSCGPAHAERFMCHLCGARLAVLFCRMLEVIAFAGPTSTLSSALHPCDSNVASRGSVVSILPGTVPPNRCGGAYYTFSRPRVFHCMDPPEWCSFGPAWWFAFPPVITSSTAHGPTGSPFTFLFMQPPSQLSLSPPFDRLFLSSLDVHWRRAWPSHTPVIRLTRASPLRQVLSLHPLVSLRVFTCSADLHCPLLHSSGFDLPTSNLLPCYPCSTGFRRSCSSSSDMRPRYSPLRATRDSLPLFSLLSRSSVPPFLPPPRGGRPERAVSTIQDPLSRLSLRNSLSRSRR